MRNVDLIKIEPQTLHLSSLGKNTRKADGLENHKGAISETFFERFEEGQLLLTLGKTLLPLEEATEIDESTHGDPQTNHLYAD